jgi:Dynein light chain type 1
MQTDAIDCAAAVRCLGTQNISAEPYRTASQSDGSGCACSATIAYMPSAGNDGSVCALQALEKYNIEKDIAAYIKKEFDKKYNPTWHCIVGRNFGMHLCRDQAA